MGFFDHLKKQAASQFIEVIEWLDESADTLVHRFPCYHQEIKMGARLTVRENQQALFVNEGKAADLFAPGLHSLSTRNLPILTTLAGWKHGFQSPFKAEVYFFNTRLFADLKWGTSTPVMMRDPELGMIRLRAFGVFAMRIVDARVFFSTIVGTKGLTTTDEITGQLRSTILSRFSDAAAEAGIAALDMAANYDELSAIGLKTISGEFASFGLELSRFLVENISLPDQVQSAIDGRTRLGVLGDRLGHYTQLQAAEAMTIAAANPGGAAAAGVGLGAGMVMAQSLAQSLAAQPPPPTETASAPRWSVSIEGVVHGPFTAQTVAEMVAGGRLSPGTLAWRPGAAGWAALTTYPEFSALAPPPPPDRRPAT